MFCPVCNALSFPRKGIKGKEYERITSKKKSEEEYTADMERHEMLKPEKKDFDDFEIYSEEYHWWTYNKPSRFTHEGKKDFEKEGKDYIQCPEAACGYHGPADGVDEKFMNNKTTMESEKREYEVISDADQQQGILTTNTYMCPKCDGIEVYAYLEQTRSSDEPETRMLTCANVQCKHGWREY